MFSNQKSQAGISPFNFQSQIERIKSKATKIAEEEQTANKKRKGLDFMAFRLSVAEAHFELSITKQINQVEDNLLKLIEMNTIGAQNSKRNICSASEFCLADIAEKMRLKKNKMYVALKSLQQKGLIIRKPTRFKGLELIGLNPAKFGGRILIEKSDREEKRRHLSVVQNTDSSTPQTEPSESADRTEPVPNSYQSGIQDTEIKEEKSPLESSRINLEVLRSKSGVGEEVLLPVKSESGSGSETWKTEWTQQREEERRMKLKRQAFELFGT